VKNVQNIQIQEIISLNSANSTIAPATLVSPVSNVQITTTKNPSEKKGIHKTTSQSPIGRVNDLSLGLHRNIANNISTIRTGRSIGKRGFVPEYMTERVVNRILSSEKNKK
jgi:hypothetical protein